MEKNDLILHVWRERNFDDFDSDLRIFCCPNCMNTEKEIQYRGEYSTQTYSTHGGFMEVRYRYMTHRCTACGAKFVSAKRGEARLNKEAIGYYILFALCVAAMMVTTGFLWGNTPIPLWLIIPCVLIIFSTWYGNCLMKIEDNTYKTLPDEKTLMTLIEVEKQSWFPREEDKE